MRGHKSPSKRHKTCLQLPRRQLLQGMIKQRSSSPLSKMVLLRPLQRPAGRQSNKRHYSLDQGSQLRQNNRRRKRKHSPAPRHQMRRSKRMIRKKKINIIRLTRGTSLRSRQLPKTKLKRLLNKWKRQNKKQLPLRLLLTRRQTTRQIVLPPIKTKNHARVASLRRH